MDFNAGTEAARSTVVNGAIAISSTAVALLLRTIVMLYVYARIDGQKHRDETLEESVNNLSFAMGELRDGADRLKELVFRKADEISGIRVEESVVNDTFRRTFKEAFTNTFNEFNQSQADLHSATDKLKDSILSLNRVMAGQPNRASEIASELNRMNKNAETLADRIQNRRRRSSWSVWRRFKKSRGKS